MHSEVAGHSEKLHEYLPLGLDYIPEELKRKARSELFEDEDTRIHSLRLLRNMLKEEPGLKWQDEDLFLLAFLRARKFDVKKAFHLIKIFYTVKAKREELYLNFNFEDVRKTLSEKTFGFLPRRDSEGCVIIVLILGNWNPHSMPMSDAMRSLTTGLLHAIQSPATQIAGFKAIVDFRGLPFSHIPYASPTYVWMLAEALQSTFPGRFREIHVIYEGAIFSYFWTILKQILKKKIRDRVHMHGKNVKKLHKYFPTSLLPAEFEGELPPMENSEWERIMTQDVDRIYECYKYGYEKGKVKTQSSSHSNS